MVDLSSLLAAVCFLTADILGVVFVANNLGRNHFDFELFKKLDSAYLQEEWEHRSSTRSLLYASTIIKTFGWLFFIIPVMHLSWGLSYGGTRKIGIHVAMAVLVLVGSMTEIISRLLLIGSETATRWIRDEFELNFWLSSDLRGGSTTPDGLGWKALEITLITVDSMQVWVDAFEWFCLMIILVLMYYSVATMPSQHRQMPLWWAALGLVIALLAVLDFTANVLRFDNWREFSRFALFTTMVNSLLLVLWLLVVAFSLHRVSPTRPPEGASPNEIQSMMHSNAKENGEANDEPTLL